MADDKTHTPEQPKTGIEYKECEDFVELYANNVQFFSSNWDLELHLGQLDQKQGPNVVVQKASVTLSWATAKILWYFLSLNLIGHEGDFGRIIIPTGIVPEVPAHKPKELAHVKDEAFQAARKFYLDFVARNPEAGPRQS